MDDVMDADCAADGQVADDAIFLAALLKCKFLIRARVIDPDALVVIIRLQDSIVECGDFEFGRLLALLHL